MTHLEEAGLFRALTKLRKLHALLGGHSLQVQRVTSGEEPWQLPSGPISVLLPLLP